MTALLIGVILLVVGAASGIGVLFWIGAVVAVVGVLQMTGVLR